MATPEGLIPAHAGKTSSGDCRAYPAWAHPRSRGENRACAGLGAWHQGSSPLTRGKPSDLAVAGGPTGLIPAHAGKTDKCLNGIQSGSAHPRSRGENMLRRKSPAYIAGSSPLTRGKRPQRLDELPEPGLIPAHAGKTCRCRLRSRPATAHPRSRGENLSAAETPPPPAGSSPLTRGKPCGSVFHHRDGGLIPAHAGKTDAVERTACRDRAHPRSRGENPVATLPATIAPGSSPLTRGKRQVSHEGVHRGRLIPAHAGKTLPDLRFYCADRSDLGNP